MHWGSERRRVISILWSVGAGGGESTIELEGELAPRSDHRCSFRCVSGRLLPRMTPKVPPHRSFPPLSPVAPACASFAQPQPLPPSFPHLAQRTSSHITPAPKISSTRAYHDNNTRHATPDHRSVCGENLRNSERDSSSSDSTVRTTQHSTALHSQPPTLGSAQVCRLLPWPPSSLRLSILATAAA